MLKNQRGEISEIIMVIVIFIFIIGVIGTFIYTSIEKYCNEQEKEIIVKDKYIKNGNGKNSSSKYLVVDTENNTYEITDLTFIGKWNSTDLYNQLEINHKYKIKTTGNRIHFFSMYPNINEIEIIE